MNIFVDSLWVAHEYPMKFPGVAHEMPEQIPITVQNIRNNCASLGAGIGAWPAVGLWPGAGNRAGAGSWVFIGAGGWGEALAGSGSLIGRGAGAVVAVGGYNGSSAQFFRASVFHFLLFSSSFSWDVHGHSVGCPRRTHGLPTHPLWRRFGLAAGRHGFGAGNGAGAGAGA